MFIRERVVQKLTTKISEMAPNAWIFRWFGFCGGASECDVAVFLYFLRVVAF